MTIEGRVFVTGATGFVGRALVAHLLRGGVTPPRLRLLVRDPARAVAAGLPAASLEVGHLGDPAALARAAVGADLAFHVAGAIKARVVRDFYATNAMGTAAVVDALRAHAPGCRLVHVSSLAAAGPSVDGETSALPPQLCAPCSHYGKSKRDGEIAVQAASDLRWIILRPPIVYGPGDPVTGLLLRQALAPLVPVPWTRRPLSLIHIRDLVAALHLAARSPLTRRVLPVEGPNRVDSDSLLQGLAQAAGRRARLLRVPLSLTWPAAVASDLFGYCTGRVSVFGRDKLRDLRAVGWVADPVPAREAIDFVPAVSSRVGFAAVVDGEA